jgi:hypothetical protein
MAEYTPDPNTYHETITIPDDSSAHDAAAWGMAYEQLADNAAHVQRFEGGWYVFNFHPPAMVPGEYYANAAGFAAAVVQSASAGGVPVLCAVAEDGATRRVVSPAGGSISDVSATLAAATIVSLAGGMFDGAESLVAIGFSGGVYQSTDLGMTWTSVGVPTDARPTGIVAYWPAIERWLIADQTASRMYWTDDLATWTAGTGAGSAPATPRKIACSETAAVCVYRGGSATQCARSTDGAAWTLLTLSAAGHDWRGVAYSVEHDLWIAVANDGVGSVSEDGGASWTEVAIPAGAQDVIAFKRWLVVVCTNVHGGLGASVAVSKDLGDTWAEFMLDGDPLANAYDRLLPLGADAVVAVGRDDLDRMRVAFSLRAPTL